MCVSSSNCVGSLVCWSTQCHMEEKGVILVMVNYVCNGWKGEVAYHILPLCIRVNVKVFNTAEKKYRSQICTVLLFERWSPCYRHAHTQTKYCNCCGACMPRVHLLASVSILNWSYDPKHNHIHEYHLQHRTEGICVGIAPFYIMVFILCVHVHVCT